MLKTTIDQITQLSFLPRLFPINVYLVEESDGLTLIDAGMSFTQKGILQAAEAVGKPITRIVLTHAHGDHVGALDGLKKELPNATVCISQRDAQLLKGNTELLPGEENTPIRGDIPKSITTVPDVLLHDGDRVGSLRAIATPGHTPGHMAFFDERSGILIAGDSWQTRGGLAVSGVIKPWFPFPAMATWSKKFALESAASITALHPTVLAVGHGRMLSNPTDAMKKALTHAESMMRRNAQ
ncbi:MBL fold metallo-hydrolase [Paenibacillus solani]|uniref:MBL fold metallo-hydrolase n=1 Tax=Paenibacillus solani TaxID=1705565 RepID=UPI003D2ADB12